MNVTEETFLLQSDCSASVETLHNKTRRTFSSGLSVLFAVICIVDVFGVFPIVALPKSIIECGIHGIFVVIIVSSLQIYTSSLLGRCWLIAEQIDPKVELKSRYPYSALAELTFGNRLSQIVTFFLDVTIFTGGIPNLLVASQTLQLLGRRVTESAFDFSFCYWIILIGTLLCPLLWLGSPKDMKLLCTISATMVLATFLLVIFSMVFDTRSQGQENEDVFVGQRAGWVNMITAYGIITFQFDIHPTILTIHVDMDDKRKITRVVIAGFLVSLSMFAITTSIAFWRYGSTVKTSLLGSLPTSIALHMAALLVALQLCLTLAVSNSALYQHLEDCLGISRDFNHRRCILRTVLSAFAIFLAETVPKFDVVMSLIGGTFIGPLVFILPPLYFIRIKGLKCKHDEKLQLAVFKKIMYNAALSEDIACSLRREAAAHHEGTMYTDYIEGNWGLLETLIAILIIASGLLFTISSTYLNISNIIEYATFSQPCLYNLTLDMP